MDHDDLVAEAWRELDELLGEDPDAPELGSRCRCGFDTHSCAQQGVLRKDKASATWVCEVCGFVFQDRWVDDTADWNDKAIHEAQGSQSTCRTGAAIDPLFPKSSLNLQVSVRHTKRGTGTDLSLDRLKQLQSWISMPSDERSLWHVLQNLIAMASRLQGLIPPSAVRSAVALFRDITKEDTPGHRDIYRCRVRRGLIAACLAHTMQHMGRVFTSHELAELLDVSTDEMARGCKLLYKVVAKKPELKDQVVCVVVSPSDLAMKYAIKLGFPPKLCTLSSIITDACTQLAILPSSTPQTLLAGVLWFVITESALETAVPKGILAAFLNVSEVSVLKTYAVIRTHQQAVLSVALSLKENNGTDT